MEIKNNAVGEYRESEDVFKNVLQKIEPTATPMVNKTLNKT